MYEPHETNSFREHVGTAHGKEYSHVWQSAKFLVIVHGTREQVANAKDILGKTGASGVTAHQD